MSLYACYAQPDFASSTDSIDIILTLPNSSFPLPQCTRLEIGKPFGVVSRFSIVDTCFESEDILDEVHALAATPLEGSSDVFMCEDFPSLGFDSISLFNPLDHSHVSFSCLLPSPLPEYHIFVPIDNLMIHDVVMDLGYEDNVFYMLGGSVDDYVSLGYFRGYDNSIDPYCVCLEDLPRKVM